MWILSCSGNLLNDKRLWLRPGSSHLLGRTSGRPENGQRVQYIDHKSVSRKHLLITVGQVSPEDSSKLHKRTDISLTDGSKAGTSVNGEKLSQDTRTLDGKKYTIKLGSYEHSFELVWRDVVLTFSSLGKKGKRGDALAAQKEQLAGTDFKLTTEYIANLTSHVIAKKRNIPAVLQALCQSRWVVTSTWLDALTSAARRRGLDAPSDDTMSLLEQDFDANWPAEGECVVPSAGEPVPRPDDFLHPQPERAEVFHNYTFVFLSDGQYGNLLPVITTGGGKAVLWELQSGESTVDDFVDYIRELAGKKRDNQYRLSQTTGKGGIVLVRVGDDADSWSAEFDVAIQRALDQRSIKQNELLDTILTLDTTGLRKALPEEEDSASMGQSSATAQGARPTPPVSQQPSNSAQAESQASHTAAADQANSERPTPASSTVSRLRNRRPAPQPLFKGFDDFDPSQFTRPASESPPPAFSATSQIQDDEDMHNNSSRGVHGDAGPSRKRPAPDFQDEAASRDALYDELLPAQAAFKKQKLEDARLGRKDVDDEEVSAVERVRKETVSKPKEEAKIDVKAELSKRREEAADARRKDEEMLRDMASIDVKELQNLAKVEIMELPLREPPPRRAARDDEAPSERWDPAWNGRKNFKKFRPQGQRREGPRLQRVIVTLEEVPRKGHGIGDEYWLSSGVTQHSTNASSKGNKSQHTQSQRARQPSADPFTDADGNEDDASFRRRLQRSREEDRERAIDAAVMLDDGDMSRVEALQQIDSTPSQTLGTESQRRAAGKRPATQQIEAPPAKKARQSRLTAAPPTITLDDDDDDGVKFTRRRRRA